MRPFQPLLLRYQVHIVSVLSDLVLGAAAIPGTPVVTTPQAIKQRLRVFRWAGALVCGALNCRLHTFPGGRRGGRGRRHERLLRAEVANHAARRTGAAGLHGCFGAEKAGLVIACVHV